MTDIPVPTEIIEPVTIIPPAVIVDNTSPSEEYSLILVLDGIVQDMITCQARLASVLLSRPIVVELASSPRQNLIGWTYDAINNQVLPPSMDQS